MQNVAKVTRLPGFQRGNKENPGGRPALAPEVRMALRADTLPRYRRLMALSLKAEAEGNLALAATIELKLFGKQVPDLQSVALTDANGESITQERVNLANLSEAQLIQFRSLLSLAAAPQGDAQ